MPGRVPLADRALVGAASLLLGAGAGTAALAGLAHWERDLSPHPLLLTGASGIVGLALALGARWGGRRADDLPRPLRRAALLLLLLAAWTRAVPWILETLATWAAATDGALAPLAAAAAALGPLGLLLGAALPLLARQGSSDLTAAGALGANVLAGVVLGLSLATWSAPALHVLLAGGPAAAALPVVLMVAALLAFVVDRRRGRRADAPAGVPGRHSEGRDMAWSVLLAGALLGLGGAAGARLLEPALDAGSLAPALLLGAAALAGCVGLFLAGALARHASRPAVVLAWVLGLAGATFVWVLVRSGPLALRRLGVAPGAGTLLGTGGQVLLVVGPTALLLGAIVPLAVQVRSDWTGRPAEALGRLVAGLCAGAVLGALVGSWGLVPALGAPATLVAAAAVAMAGATVVALRTPGRGRLPLVGAGLVALALLAWPGVLAGLAGRAPQPTTLWLLRSTTTAPLPALRDAGDVGLFADLLGLRVDNAGVRGRQASLVRLAGAGRSPRWLADGLEIAGGGADRRVTAPAGEAFEPEAAEVVLGLLAAALHPAPRRVEVVGMGSGVVPRLLAAAGATSIGVTDLEPRWPEVLDAEMGADTAPWPPEVDAIRARSPRAAVRHAAARQPGHLQAIAINLMPLARPGHADLLDGSGLADVAAALADGGLAVIALDLDDLDRAAAVGVVAAFEATFPASTLWRLPGHLLLAGRRGTPVTIDPLRWEQVFRDPRMRSLGRPASLDTPGGLLRHLGADAAGVARLLGDDPARTQGVEGGLAHRIAERRLRRDAPVPTMPWLATAFPPDLARALPDPRLLGRWGADALDGWLADGRVDIAHSWAEVVVWPTDAALLGARARVALALGDAQRALGLVRIAREERPQDATLARVEADALAQLPQATEHARALEALGAAFPEDGEVLMRVGRALARQGQTVAGVEAMEAAIALHDALDVPAGWRAEWARTWIGAAELTLALEQQALAALRTDPATYEDPELMDLLLRTDAIASAEASDVAGGARALATLIRQRSEAHLDAARRAWLEARLAEADREATEATAVDGGHVGAWEFRGLVRLGMTVAAPGDESGMEALQEGLERAPDRPRAAARARRLLALYGRRPADAADAPQETR